MTIKVLDLFCGAGGAGMGYHLAGFDVFGVDINPQPRYPFPYHRGDALEYAKEHGHEYDLWHASPACQRDCMLTAGTNQGRQYPDLTTPIMNFFRGGTVPYVIENPPGRTPIRRDVVLCGEMFGLGVLRHRVFELGNWTVDPIAIRPAHVKHRGRVAGWRHGIYYDGPYVAVYGDGGGKGSVMEWQHAMGITWTDDKRELAEAIPPAYTLWLGGAFDGQLHARPMC